MTIKGIHNKKDVAALLFIIFTIAVLVILVFCQVQRTTEMNTQNNVSKATTELTNTVSATEATIKTPTSRFDIDVDNVVKSELGINSDSIGIITDKATGVMYMVITFDKAGNKIDGASGVSITPMYNADGSLLINSQYQNSENTTS